MFGHNLFSFYKRYQDCINISLLVAISILVFYNSLSSYFLPVDDLGLMIRNYSSPFLSNTYGVRNQGGAYAPITIVSFLFDNYLYGNDNPSGHHLTNLIVHIFNVIFVYIIAFYLTRKKVIGLVAGLLFVVHPLHSQSLPPVGWIAGRSDPIVSFFYLLTIILFMRFLSKGSSLIYLISFATFILALMSKEMAVTLPFVILLYVLLFPDYQEGKEAYHLEKKAFSFLLLGGILSIVLGIILNPNFIVSYLSYDGILEQSDVKKIYFLQSRVIGSGFIIILASVLLKLSRKAFASKLLLLLPYLAILFFYFIARSFILGGLVGGWYLKSEGGHLMLQLGLDTFMRDIFSLFALVWSVGTDYHIDVLTLQIEHTFIFYTVSIIVSITLALILFRLITTRLRVLTFGYLWIFITLMPVHNILIVPWLFNSRYLYLPSVGFCVFISILLYKLTQLRNVPSRLTKVIVIAFILLIVSLNSIFIIKHGEKLAKSSDIVQKFVSDIKGHQSKISDMANLYFIAFPLSPIDTIDTAVYVPALAAFMNDALNFANNSDDYKRYRYNFFLFLQGGENSQVNMSWLNERSFIIDGIDPTNCFLISNELSSIEKKIKEIYGAAPQPMLQALPQVGTKETDSANITVLKLDKKSGRIKLKVELKKPSNNSKSDHFFMYEKGHFQVLEESYGKK